MFQLTWDQFEKEIFKLAKKVKDKDFQGILAIAAGGIVPAYYLSKLLNIPRIEAITLKSYSGIGKNGLKVLNLPSYAKKDKILIIDDLIDSGDTMNIVRKRFPEGKTLVLYIKGKEQHADYFLSRKSKQQWIVFPWEIYEVV